MHGGGLNLYSPPDPLHAPPWVGHDNGPGGGKSPPPLVLTVWHIHLLGSIEWDTSGHVHLCQGCVAEVQAVGRGRGLREHGSGLSVLQATVGGGDLL